MSNAALSEGCRVLTGPRHACRFQTLYEMFEDLSAGKRDPRAPTGRLPVLLLLGGGMAAGKSTVREIIGHDDFWSKARADACIALHRGFGRVRVGCIWGYMFRSAAHQSASGRCLRTLPFVGRVSCSARGWTP